MKRPEDLRTRTRDFALSVIRLYTSLPRSTEAQVLGRQVLRSGTSVGAHYREAHRSRSTAEFVSKLQGGLQELEETAYWLELLQASGITATHEAAQLAKEPDELTAIFVTAVKGAKQRAQRPASV